MLRMPCSKLAVILEKAAKINLQQTTKYIPEVPFISLKIFLIIKMYSKPCIWVNGSILGSFLVKLTQWPSRGLQKWPKLGYIFNPAHFFTCREPMITQSHLWKCVWCAHFYFFYVSNVVKFGQDQVHQPLFTHGVRNFDRRVFLYPALCFN